jgi:hypothetical protein
LVVINEQTKYTKMNLSNYLAILFIFLTYMTYGQDAFQYSKSDTINKTKNQIYTDTKIFIANTWRSSQHVIQNDDKDAGIIIIRGSTTHKVNHLLNVYTYVYSYTFTFMMKDNKYKISLDNVFCDKAYPVGQANYNICKIEPFNETYIKCKTGYNGPYTLPEKKAIEMMDNLRTELMLIYYDYEKYISKSSKMEDW